MSAAVEVKKGYRVIDRRGTNAGKPMAFGSGVYATPRNTQQQEFYRPRQWAGPNLKKAVDQYDWTELLEYSRQLFVQRGNLGAAVIQKNLYAVGDAWQAQYFGQNKKWGDEVEEWLTDVWYPNCDVRGGIWDFATNLFLTGVGMDVDGDDIMLLAIREDGFPQLKLLMAHEIGGSEEVKGGAWDGFKVDNGVICGPNQEFVGVRVLNEEGDPTDVPAHQCQLLFEPEFRNTYRGIPRIGKSILDWFDVEDIDSFLKRGVKLDASIGLLHYTEDGGAPTASDILNNRGADNTNTNVDPADVKFEKRMGGEVYYMRAGRGEKVEGFKGERPHPNSEAFVERVERRGFAAMQWFYEMLDPSKLRGGSTRMIQDQVRHSIRNRQKTLRKRAKRAVHFAVMQAQQAGFVSKNPDPRDQFRWGFGLPALPTVDQGYEDDADREGLKLGTRTLSSVCQKAGEWWEDVRGQQQVENEDWITRAMNLVKFAKAQGGELSFEKALEMVKQVGPNPVAQQKDAKDKSDEKEEKD